MRNISPIATKQYTEKADQFLKGMKLLNNDSGDLRYGVGLLAVHSAISLSDAISVGLTGDRGKYQDHTQAARELKRLCASNKVSDVQGIRHFEWLLGRKNAIAYEDRRFGDDSMRLAVEKAERFNVWAYNHFKEILRGE